MCRTEDDAERPHLAFPPIIVPTDTPGYNIVREVPVFGELEGDHCEVEYDNVRVPANNLLGARGQGFLLAQKRLGPGRVFHCHALPRPAPAGLRPHVRPRRAPRSRSAGRSPRSS